jgi:hypothetical protein
MSPRPLCDICNRPILAGAQYIVRIDVFADPSIPDMSTDDLEESDSEKTMAKLMHEMEQLSADELQDQVHRRFQYTLCRSCQKEFLTNPLGRPRSFSIKQQGHN